MSARLKAVKNEVPDEVLLALALELAQQEEETVQRLCEAVLARDLETADQLAKELKGQ